MGCVVEVTVTEDELVGQMNHMRAWLDHRRFEPSSFTLSDADGRRVVRVLFKNDSEAAAFAAEFGGRPLSSADSGHVAA
jgi:outer membrane lipoprotein-sorting protein